MSVSIQRFVQELEKLKAEMAEGNLKHGEYDQRLARVIQETRDAGLESDRAGVTAAIADALARGVITPGVKAHLEKRLGLA